MRDFWNVIRSARLPIYVVIAKQTDHCYTVQICGFDAVTVTILGGRW